MSRVEDFEKEPLSGFGISFGAKHEVQGIAL
jgi:hypothetical protein